MSAKLALYLVVLTNVLVHTQAIISSGNETWLNQEEEPHAFATNMWLGKSTSLLSPEEKQVTAMCAQKCHKVFLDPV